MNCIEEIQLGICLVAKSFSLINESLVNGLITWLLQYIAKKELYIEGYFRQKVFSFNQFAIMIALIIKQKFAFPNLTNSIEN